MLTRRSRKPSATTPTEPSVSPKKRSSTPGRRVRSVSKSVERRVRSGSKVVERRVRSGSKVVERRVRSGSKVRTRSRSANKNLAPTLILERYDKKDVPQKTTRETRGNKSNAPNEEKNKSLPPGVESGSINNSRSSPFKEKKIDNDKVLNSVFPSILDYESDDESQLKNIKKAPISPVEFGGSFGNLLLTVSLPILVILSKIALKTKGNLIPFPRGYLRFANYYDQDVFIWTAAILAIQFLISLVPMAKKSENLSGYPKIYYRFSGFRNLIIGALIVAAMEYYKCPVNFILEIVTKKTVPHIVASVLLTMVITVVLYVKAKITKQIDTLNSFNLIQNLFIGTSINPTLGPVNVKLALYRYSMLMTILFNALVIMDSLKSPVNLNLYFVCGLQIFYAIDKLVFEINLLPSFYLQNEKDGFWTIIQQFLQPIINFLPVQILLAKNIPINYYILGISSVLFLLGYVFQRYSDFTKYQCELDARCLSSPSGLETVVTSDGRKIIVSSLWSLVRYPNYLGTIIVHIAIIMPIIEPNLESLQASWPIFLYPVYYIVTLSHRCARVSTHSQLRYGYSWDCHYAVKWNLIPKIF